MVDAGKSLQFGYLGSPPSSFEDTQQIKQSILNQAVGESTCFIMCWNKHSAADSQKVMTQMFNRAERFFKTPGDAIVFVRDVINANNDGGGIALSDANAAMENLAEQLMTLSLVGGLVTYNDLNSSGL